MLWTLQVGRDMLIAYWMVSQATNVPEWSLAVRAARGVFQL
jgi:hypothetical protein